MVAPDSEDAVAAEVRRAAEEGLTVRVAGSGHSFTELVATDGVVISLDNLAGIESVRSDLATVWAGIKIEALGPPLRAAGLALANQGDIDKQAIAGAVSTGTHGTGARFGSISTGVASVRVVNGSGEVVEVSVDDDPAIAVGIGAMGVLTAVTLRCKPTYRLHERMWQEPFDAAMRDLDEHIADHDHFEFFWFPGQEVVEAKSLDETDAQPDPMDGVEGERIDHSDAVYPSDRDFKFNEMEYAVPIEAGPACFLALRTLMLEQHPKSRWPIEYRTVAADGIPLSGFEGRGSVTLSIHEDARRDHTAFFADAERLFLDHGGRPHWGKLHSLDASRLAELYPRWDEFQATRKRLDPDGRFMSPYLRNLLGD